VLSARCGLRSLRACRGRLADRANLHGTSATSADMNATAPDQQFWNIADTVIHAANAQCDGAPRTKVAAATLFAAARFNVFVLAAGVRSGAELAARHDEAVAYLTDQFGRMLRDNLQEYEANFERYVPQTPAQSA